MKRIGCVLLLALCVIGLGCSAATAQSGTTGDVPAASSPIVNGGFVEGTVEAAPEPIPVESYNGPSYNGPSYGGEVINEGYADGGSSCNCNGPAAAAPVYDSYSTGYLGYDAYGGACCPSRTRLFSGLGYRPLFGGLFSRRSVSCCP